MNFNSFSSFFSTSWPYKVFFWLVWCGATPFAGAQTARIDPYLMQRIESDPAAYHSVIIVLADQVDTRALLYAFEADRLPLAERSEQVISRLQAKAAATQPPVLERLSALSGVEAGSVYSLWIVNVIHVRANAAALRRIAGWPEVGEVVWNAPVQIIEPVLRQEASAIPNGKEPGLAAIKAPFMWKLGYTGYGRKALVIDTGNDAEHPALRDNYWGHQVPKNQAWHGSGEPEDCASHGTHVTGTVCGLDRLTNDTIGVAFNAHWMGGPMQFPVGSDLGCASSFSQTVFSNIATMQWALNPDGNAATVDDQPDVVNCSWRAAPFGCGDAQAMAALNALEAAGIGVVWAAGNSGPDAGTVSSGAAMNMDLVNTFAVGAVDGASPSFPIAGFSSRGPSPCGGSGPLLIKPEVVAPGVSVRSAVPGTGYQSFNGTSMAAPHAAGALVLLREAFPYLSGIQLKLALYYSARDLGAPGEDNVYGRGIIDLEAAYAYLLQQGHTPVPPTPWNVDVLTVDVKVSGKCIGPVSATATIENAGKEPISTLEIRYGIEGSPLQTYHWTGLLAPDAFTTVSLPPLDGVAPGKWNYVVELHQPNDQPDDRPLNNRFKRAFEMADEHYPAAIVLQQEPLCSGARALLAYGKPLATSEEAQWFTSPLILSPTARGPYFLTPPLNKDTTYYVGESAFYKVGRPDLSAGTNQSTSTDGGLLFNSFKPFILRSVKVYADQTGVRTFRLIDKDGKTLVNRPIVISQTGEQRIALNIQVPEGEKLALVLIGTNPLRHSVGSAGFPYVVPGVVSIAAGRTPGGGSTTLFYYYFFDWEIEVPSVCGRVAIPLKVNSSVSAPTVSFSVSPDTVFLPGTGTVVFTDQTPGAVAWRWFFGNGQEGAAHQESTAYTEEGVYRVRLIAATANGCSNVAEREVVVLKNVSLDEAFAWPVRLQLYPNPARQHIRVNYPADGPIGSAEVWIINALGQIVSQYRVAMPWPDDGYSFDVSTLPAGHYTIQVRQDGRLWGAAAFAHW